MTLTLESYQEHLRMNDAEFSKQLRYLRDRAGLTQKQLAAEIGLHHRSIANYEGGRSVPKQKREQLLDVLIPMIDRDAGSAAVQTSRSIQVSVDGKVVGLYPVPRRAEIRILMD